MKTNRHYAIKGKTKLTDYFDDIETPQETSTTNDSDQEGSMRQTSKGMDRLQRPSQETDQGHAETGSDQH